MTEMTEIESLELEIRMLNCHNMVPSFKTLDGKIALMSKFNIESTLKI